MIDSRAGSHASAGWREPEMQPHEQQQAALRYYDAGYMPVPLVVGGKKLPPIKWGYLKDKRASRFTVKSWFGWDAKGVPEPSGIGLLCGPVSMGLELLDFDDGELFEPWAAKIPSDLFNRLTHNVTPREPSGHHIMFRCTTYDGNCVLAKMSKQEAEDKIRRGEKVSPLIETRGYGGLMVAVGSHPKTHKTGKPYRHVGGPPPWEVALITPEERMILWEAALSFDRSDMLQSQINEAIRKERNKNRSFKVSDTVERFKLETDWADILIPADWQPTYENDSELWTRPGKDPSEGHSATTKVTDDGDDVFTCFSSDENAAPVYKLGANGGYTPMSKFEVYKRLHHNGNHREACLAIERKWKLESIGSEDE